MQVKYKLKKDRYTNARGGSSSFLTICCSICNHPVLLYQKDGPGNLLRMYLDKIVAPIDLANLTNIVETKIDIPKLLCPKCQTILALPIIYKPEQRPAFLIIRGKTYKSKYKGIFPPNGADSK